MISLGTQVEPDRMSSLIHRCLGYRLRVERKTPKSWGQMYYYPVQRVNSIVVVLSMLCSASLLVGAIMALYFVKPIGVRLGIVGGRWAVGCFRIGQSPPLHTHDSIPYL